MSLPVPKANNVLSVSRLNQLVKTMLENEIGQIWLMGEISNFSQPVSGHWYFTLKDNQAQVRCAMFRGYNQRTAFKPQNGQQVLVRANITLYEPRGEYQLVVESIHPAGDGLLQQRFEELKQRLAQEGLFDLATKKPLPSPAKRVGIITSSSGAALHDILQILKRRDPGLPVIIYPTAVQGKEAAQQIAATIALANQRAECDVLIVGRGGGALEDLWSFNEEVVARAIFASQIPIISAVGHETDVTISDFVADLRAPTPSAAAELVSRNQQELIRQLQAQQQRMEMAMDYYLARLRQHYNRLLHRLQQQHPQLRLSRQLNSLLQIQRKMHSALQQQLKRKAYKIERLTARLNQQQPQRKLFGYQQQMQQLSYRLQQAINQQLQLSKQRIAVNCSQLQAVSPLATLARGYSITNNKQQRVIKSIVQVKVGEMIESRVSDGIIRSQIITISPKTA